MKKKNHKKSLDECLMTLRVLYTWATFEDGEMLVPKHVGDLTAKTLARVAKLMGR